MHSTLFYTVSQSPRHVVLPRPNSLIQPGFQRGIRSRAARRSILRRINSRAYLSTELAPAEAAGLTSDGRLWSERVSIQTPNSLFHLDLPFPHPPPRVRRMHDTLQDRHSVPFLTLNNSNDTNSRLR